MKQVGFTLIELVAALAIFALLSVMAYGGLGALINTREGLDVAYERLQDWQIAVNRMRQDISQTRMRPVRDAFGDFQPALHEPEEGRLVLTHGGRRNPLVQPRSHLERVAWYLDTDGTLIRQHWLSLDSAQADQPIKTEVLKDIVGLGWRYLDEDDEWVEDWPPARLSASPAQELPLPRAVELTLDSKQLGELEFIFAIMSQP